jgi:hypothetical protein
VVAIIATFNFVCFTMLFFPIDLKGRVDFLRAFITGHTNATAVAGAAQ